VHSAAVETGGTGVVVAGWSESGRTETALALMEAGGRFVSDKWTILGEDGTLACFPIGVGVRRWVLPYLPRLRAALPRPARAQLLAAGAAGRITRPLRGPASRGKVLTLAGDAAERAVGLADRAGLRPSELIEAYGHCAGGAPRTSLGLLVLLRTVPGPAVSAREVDGKWAAPRLARTAAFERRRLFELHQRARFAMPEHEQLDMEATIGREQAFLSRVLARVRVIQVDAPFPTDPAALRRRSPCCGGDRFLALGGRRLERRYAFGRRLGLSVVGPRAAIRHYEAEYDGSRAEAPSEPDVRVAFGARLPAASSAVVRGGHKLLGAPRAFGHSLVQGYFVEPMLSLAAVRHGRVLLPAAAIREGDGAVLIMGRSGSGKSSLSARALAEGRAILGDDQVLLDGSGQLWTFPRRLRFYADLRHTAPAAYRRLPLQARFGLAGREAVRRLTRGFVAPPIRVTPAELGGGRVRDPLPLSSVVMISREPGARELETEEINASEAVDLGIELLRAQRAHLERVDDSNWGQLLETAERQEAELLRSALNGRPGSIVRVPERWGAPRALDALSRRLLPGGSARR